MTDIEFVVQYAVLRWGGEYPDLLVWTDNLRLLETLERFALLPPEDCRALHDAYFAYRADGHRCALLQTAPVTQAERHATHRAAVTAIWNKLFNTDAAPDSAPPD